MPGNPNCCAIALFALGLTEVNAQYTCQGHNPGCSGANGAAAIKQIEILRGPQGTLYGRNTMGGVIHVITNPPGPVRSTQIGAEYAGYGIAALRFSHDQPLVNDKLGLQVAGQYRKRSGFFKNDFTGDNVDKQQSGSGRIKLNYDPSQRLKIQWIMNF